MKFDVETLKTVTPSGVEVTHKFIRQATPTPRLLVILPGRGYTTEHPVLYYLQKAAAELGYDVLSITYSFQVSASTFNTMNLPAEIDTVLGLVNPDAYQRVVFAGKSMGTPLAVTQGLSCLAEDVRLILLTPIGDAVDEVRDLSTLAIIGTEDQAYDAESIAATELRPNVTWRIMPGLNHALEDRKSWRRSAVLLQEIIAVCDAFLSEA